LTCASRFERATTLGFRECDRLEVESNFAFWKYRLQMLLEKVEIWAFVDKKVIISTNHVHLVDYKKKEAKETKIIIALLKCYLIPHIIEKKTMNEMYDAFIVLYQSLNISHKM
jgi:hypothetical protein